MILGGCASSDFFERFQKGFSYTNQASLPSEEAVGLYKDALDDCFKEYISCMQRESDALVFSKSTAYEIADASQASCLSQLDDYRAAFRKYIVASNENHYSQHVENLVQTHTRNLERDAKSKIVYKVVNSRR